MQCYNLHSSNKKKKSRKSIIGMSIIWTRAPEFQ